jgi:hypothetical protein
MKTKLLRKVRKGHRIIKVRNIYSYQYKNMFVWVTLYADFTLEQLLHTYHRDIKRNIEDYLLYLYRKSRRIITP